MRRVRILYQHPLKEGVELEQAGELPDELNNEGSDQWILKRHDGMIIDIPKDKVNEIFELS